MQPVMKFLPYKEMLDFGDFCLFTCRNLDMWPSTRKVTRGGGGGERGESGHPDLPNSEKPGLFRVKMKTYFSISYFWPVWAINFVKTIELLERVTLSCQSNYGQSKSLKFCKIFLSKLDSVKH